MIRKLLATAGLGSFVILSPAVVKANQISTHLEGACVEILKSRLKKPDSLKVKNIESTQGSDSSPGSIFIDYAASNRSGKIIQERAYCQVPDRATVSMMTAHRREYSHLN